MTIEPNDIVMHPAYAPYPLYGLVVKVEDGDRVVVTQVHCGDPRCSAEHQHADQVWCIADLRKAGAYQPQAEWEHGRKSSPNAPVMW
jgi:hypothetical protein